MRLNSLLKVNCLASMLLFSLPGFAEVDHTTTTTTKETTMSADSKTRTPADDMKITNSVKKLIHKSKMLSPLDIGVSTEKGVVMFSGHVDSDSEVTSLVELAESVVGVMDVDSSKLSVKSGNQPVTDAITTAKIKGLFIREDLFGKKDLALMGTSVETKDGVVYIIGSVDHVQQLKNAVDIIKKHVPEVKRVEFSVKKITPTTTTVE